MAEPKLRVTRESRNNRAVLTVFCSSLEMGDLFEFQAACMELLETGQPNLLIDATAIRSMTSVFLGSIVKTALQARESGQHLALSARKDVADLLRQLVGDTMVEVVNETPDGQ